MLSFSKLIKYVTWLNFKRISLMFAPTAEGIIMKVLKVIKIDNNNVLNKEKQPDNKNTLPKATYKMGRG